MSHKTRIVKVTPTGEGLRLTVNTKPAHAKPGDGQAGTNEEILLPFNATQGDVEKALTDAAAKHAKMTLVTAHAIALMNDGKEFSPPPDSAPKKP